MIGGLYLGELVRLVLVHLSQCGVLFGGCTSPALLSQGSILLEHVAGMEEYVGRLAAQTGARGACLEEAKALSLQGSCGALMGAISFPTPQISTPMCLHPFPCSPATGTAYIHTILQDLGLSLQASDAELVQCVCEAVCTRAAQLCAAALAAVLSRLQHSREQQTLRVAVATGGRVFDRHPRYSEDRILCEQVARMCVFYDINPEGILVPHVRACGCEWQTEN